MMKDLANYAVTLLIGMIIGVVVAWTLISGSSQNNNPSKYLIQPDEFYQGKIHYLSVQGKIINYTSDSIDYEAEVDTTGTLSLPDSFIIEHSELKSSK